MWSYHVSPITKEKILAIRVTPAGKSRPGRNPTRFQILPVPSRATDRRWYRVYEGRYRFIEARSGKLPVTADLEALLVEQDAFRPSKARYMVRSEVLDVMLEGKAPPHNGNSHRVATGARVLWRATEKPAPGEPPAGLSVEQLANWALRGAAWHRIYHPGGRERWLFIEVGKPIFTKDERAAGMHVHPVQRRYQGVVRIAWPYDVLKYQD